MSYDNLGDLVQQQAVKYAMRYFPLQPERRDSFYAFVKILKIPPELVRIDIMTVDRLFEFCRIAIELDTKQSWEYTTANDVRFFIRSCIRDLNLMVMQKDFVERKTLEVSEGMKRIIQTYVVKVQIIMEVIIRELPLLNSDEKREFRTWMKSGIALLDEGEYLQNVNRCLRCSKVKPRPRV